MRPLYLLLFLLSVAGPLEAAFVTNPALVVAEAKVSELNREAVEAQLGRKLRFSERIALVLARRAEKRALRKEASSRPLRKMNGFAIAGLVGGLTTLLTFGLALAFGAAGLWGICVIALALGIGFSSIALNQMHHKPDRYRGKGMAIAGLVVSSLPVITFVVLAAIVIASGGF